MSSFQPARDSDHPTGPGKEDSLESKVPPRATGRLRALNVELVEDRFGLFRTKQFHRRVALLYFLLAVAWILLTDVSVELLITDPGLISKIQTYKGLTFVTLSAGFLYFLLSRHYRHISKIERKIQARDSHIGRIIDTMANGVALIDLDATIVDINPALAHILGHTRSEIIGRKLAPVLSPEDMTTLPIDEVFRLARVQGHWSGELIRLHKDGTSVPMHLTLAPLFDAKGALTGYVGDYVDLREIKTAEARLDGLGSIIESLATEVDLEALGQKAVLGALNLTGSQIGGVVLLDPSTGQLRPRWFIDTASQPIDISTVENSADEMIEITARIIETGTAKIFSEPDQDHQRIPLVRSRRLDSLAAVPVTVRGIHRGALIIGATQDNDGLTARHLSLLQSVSRQLGVALQRNDLLEDARRSEARFRNVVNTVPDILYSASLPELKTSFISPSVERLLGHTPEEYLGNPTLWREQIDVQDRARVDDEVLERIQSKQRYSVEYRCWNRERTHYHWFEDRGRVERDEQGIPVAITGVVSDITARKHAEERLAFLAFHDRLTGLPNRTGLLEKLSTYLESEEESAGILLYCDLDGFHLVNDIHGHESGDALLIETARRLKEILPGEAILSRIGADEFVAFLPRTSDWEDDDLASEAQSCVLKIMGSFRQPFSFFEQSSYLSATLGISLSSGASPIDAKTLLNDAHRALAHAKELGPANFAFYAGELAEKQHRRLSLQSQLNNALEREEFRLHYQPIIDLRSGQIVGAEALLRWTTTSGERISPAEFIPIAEESGLIIPLGDWVLRQGCKDLGRWIPIQEDFKLSLNLSPRQFFHLEIVEKVLNAVDEARINPSSLELELTESAMLFDPEQTNQILSRLQKAGFSIAIDDFGTGYSSLERLKYLPVETLKIDRSFVKDLPDAPRDASIVSSVVTLSKNFSMTALAEGIETAEQWKFLRSLGCHFGQGYFFSPPIPAADFEALLISPPKWMALQEG